MVADRCGLATGAHKAGKIESGMWCGVWHTGIVREFCIQHAGITQSLCLVNGMPFEFCI